LADTVDTEAISSNFPSFSLLVLISDSSSIVDSTVSSNSPNVTVSTDSNVNEVGLSDFRPVSTDSVLEVTKSVLSSFRHESFNTFSVVDLILVINAPNVSISSDIDVDHSANTFWLIDLSPAILTELLDMAELLEPNVVSVVNTPKDWAVSYRDVHKFTSDLLPRITFFVGISSNVLSAHDFVIGSDTADLAVSDINVDEVSFNSYPA
jgi:hypothetical protein